MITSSIFTLSAQVFFVAINFASVFLYRLYLYVCSVGNVDFRFFRTRSQKENRSKEMQIILYQRLYLRRKLLFDYFEFRAIDSLGVTFTIWHIISSIYELLLLLYCIHVPLVFNHQTTGTTCVNNRLVWPVLLLAARPNRPIKTNGKKTRGEIANLK